MTHIEPFFDKNCACMICKKTFTTKSLRSRFIKVEKSDTDFNPTYNSALNNPLLYHIKVCPHCGFSFNDDFSKYLPPGTKELIEEKVTRHWVAREYGGVRTIQQAIQTYKLAIYCALLKTDKHITLAGMYLRVAWLYRSLENSEQEQRFMKLAINEYLESYVADDYKGTQVSEVKLLYLIGELSRRTGDISKAVKYFSKVIEKQKQSLEPRIINMAKDRWHEIREEKKLLEA